MIDESSYDAPTQRDLRDQIDAFEAAARRLLGQGQPLVLVHHQPAACHPDRPKFSRKLCRPCYDHHRGKGTLIDFPTEVRKRDDFVADYDLLRGQGYTKRQIAERLGMNLITLRVAYQRAVRRGYLTPDRRTA
jgi:hypothetical protein